MLLVRTIIFPHTINEFYFLNNLNEIIKKRKKQIDEQSHYSSIIYNVLNLIHLLILLSLDLKYSAIVSIKITRLVLNTDSKFIFLFSFLFIIKFWNLDQFCYYYFILNRSS